MKGGYEVDPLWAELINSDWRDHLGSGRREDRLGNDGWLETFLRRTCWGRRRLPSPDERERLRELRRLLRRMVDARLAGAPISESDIDALNRDLARAPVARRLEQDGGMWGVELTAIHGTIDDLLGEVAGSFAAMLARGEGDRIKVCANPDCGWVIVDSSRNRSRRWCDAAECGNVMKVRRYRQRHRETG